MVLRKRSNVAFWLQAEVRTMLPTRPVYPQQATFWARLGMSQVDPKQAFEIIGDNRPIAIS